MKKTVSIIAMLTFLSFTNLFSQDTTSQTSIMDDCKRADVYRYSLICSVIIAVPSLLIFFNGLSDDQAEFEASLGRMDINEPDRPLLSTTTVVSGITGAVSTIASIVFIHKYREYSKSCNDNK